MENHKAAWERSVFDGFAERLQIPVEDVEQPDPPDIVFRSGGKRIAVEITKYQHDSYLTPDRGSQLEKLNGGRHFVLREAKKVFDERMNRYSDINIHWMSQSFSVASPTREEMKRLAKALAELAIRLIESNLTQEVIRCDVSDLADYGNRRPSLESTEARFIARFVNSVRIFNPNEQLSEKSDWGDSGAFWVQEINQDSLRHRINEKREKLESSYQNHLFDESWLLIYIGSGESSECKVPDSLLEVVDDPGFDRMFLFFGGGSGVFTLHDAIENRHGWIVPRHRMKIE